MHGVMNMKDEDGFEPTSESTHLSLPTRYELANGFTSTPSRLLGDLEEKHLPQTFSIATRVAHDGIRIAVTSGVLGVTVSARGGVGTRERQLGPPTVIRVYFATLCPQPCLTPLCYVIDYNVTEVFLSPVARPVASKPPPPAARAAAARPKCCLQEYMYLLVATRS